MDRLLLYPLAALLAFGARPLTPRIAGRHGARAGGRADIVVTGQRVEYGVRSDQHRDQDRDGHPRTFRRR